MNRWISNQGNRKLKDELHRLIRSSTRVWLISPFVTKDGMETLISSVSHGQDLRLITRLHDEDVLSGVLNPEAIATFQDKGGRARFYKNTLHTKLWLFDNAAVIGSANLTGAALTGNLEMMVDVPLDSLHPPLEKEYERLWNALQHTEQSSEGLRTYARRMSVHPSAKRLAATHSLDLEDHGAALKQEQVNKRSGSSFWLKVNGLSTERIGLDHDFQSHAILEGGQAFPPSGQGGRGRPAMQTGDYVLLSRLGERNGRSDYCIYGRGIVDITHRPQIDELPKSVQSVCSAQIWKHLSRWPYIVWLRDVQIIKGFSSDCPWLRDISFTPGSELVPDRWAQTGRRRLGKAQYDAMAGALERAFIENGVISIPRPDDIWWNRMINQEEHRVTRTGLELAAQSAGAN